MMKPKTKFKQTEIGMVPEDWEIKKMKDIGIVVTGKTPSTKEPKFWGNGYPFVTPSDIANFTIRYNYAVEREVTEEWLKAARKYLVPHNSICFVCIGSTIGKMCLLKKPSFTNQQINSIVVNENSNPLFVFYLLRHKQIDIKNTYAGGGAAKDIIKKSTFEIINLILPKLKNEQNAIAKILSNLDSKIELNQQMNKTLEEIGKAIFKHWFIDFEFPNEQGKPYKSSGSKMIDSELGKIPNDWKVKTISEVAEVKIGRTPPRKESMWFSITEGIKWASIKDLGAASTFILNTSERLTHGAIDKFKIPIIKSGTIMLSFKLTVGRVAIAAEDMTSNEAIAHFNIDNTKVTTSYLHGYLSQFDYDSLGSTSSIATAINSDNIRTMKIILPTKKLQIKYENLMSSIFFHIKNNLLQSNSLINIRDSMLPKLMSGKIRVPAEAS